MASDALSRLERRVATVRRRVAQTPDDEYGVRASRNIQELRELQAYISDQIDDEVIRGRKQGAPWKLLGTSKQQAQQLHAAALARRSPTGLHPSIQVDRGGTSDLRGPGPRGP